MRESVAHALFDLTQNNGRLVQIHEIVAMISQYNRCRARDELKEDAPMDDFAKIPVRPAAPAPQKTTMLP